MTPEAVPITDEMLDGAAAALIPRLELISDLGWAERHGRAPDQGHLPPWFGPEHLRLLHRRRAGGDRP